MNNTAYMEPPSIEEIREAIKNCSQPLKIGHTILFRRPGALCGEESSVMLTPEIMQSFGTATMSNSIRTWKT